MSILIIDFGSQYTQLLARRIRELGYYCELQPYTASNEELAASTATGIILSGSGFSVCDNGPGIPPVLFDLQIPILGVCYGMQALAKHFGADVVRCSKNEYGHASVRLLPTKNILFGQLPLEEEWDVWMSHGDRVQSLPPKFEVCASTATCPIAAMGSNELKIFGVQFHAEVTETHHGASLFDVFCADIARCPKTWTIPRIIDNLRDTLTDEVAAGDGDVVLALSGGVDSSVVAVLLDGVIGNRLQCILIDTGLMRQNEVDDVKCAFSLHHPHMNVSVVNAQEQFLTALAGIADPEEKRKVIGAEFIKVFEHQASKLKNVKWLAQGTIYPDVIESAGVGHAVLIKSHHNVGGLPDTMNLKLLEPLRRLFKDEVRKVGIELGLPPEFVWRHPFPGPGLAVRILGPVTPDKIIKARLADHIFIEELHMHEYYAKCAQAFAAVLDSKAVAVKGDERAYDDIISLRAVTTADFMTAQMTELPFPILRKVCRRIMNEVPNVARVVFDLSDKPPGTIEYE